MNNYWMSWFMQWEVVEELVYLDPTTGASNDIEKLQLLLVHGYFLWYD